MTIRKLRLSVFVVWMLCLTIGSAYAQSGQADVQGMIADPTGSVVSGATVILTNEESGDKRTVTTGTDGRYSFPTIAPGKYSITVTAASFSSSNITGLLIQLDNHVIQNVTMHVGSAMESVTVTGSVPAVDTTAYDVGGVVQQNQIENLPIPNRQYLALALLTPGTTQAASRSFYSNVESGGGGPYFFASGFSWDGVSNQQTEEGDPRQNIPEDAVAEFKTYTASMPADLGWAMGGYTAVVSKSGTNHIHGDVFEYYRGKFLNADNQFTQATELIQKTGSPPYNRNQWGGAIGGPIFKNRTHYYGAFERTQATTSWTLFEPAGSAAATDYASLLGTFSSPQTDTLLTIRADHDLKTNQQIFFRYSQEWQLSTGSGCGGTTTTGCYDGHYPRKAYVAGHTWEPTAKIVNEARFQYAYISYELGPWNTPLPTKPSDLVNPTYSKNISLSFAFPSLSYGHNYAAVGVESRWQLNDSLTIQKGAHSIKLGIDVSYVPYVDASASNLNGTYTFLTDQPFDATTATTGAFCTTPGASNCPNAFSQSAVPLLYYLPSTQTAYFAEDSWKMRPNLTVSAGLRYDRQFGSPFLDTFTPNPAKPIPFQGDPHKRGDKNNFGPRLGFAWDPFRKQKDVIRGGYGMYYNFIETELSEAEKLNFIACPIALTNKIAPSGTPPNNFLPYPNPYNGQSVTAYCSSAAPNVTILSPTLRNPYQHQFSLGYSRQLSNDLSVSIDGLYDRGLRDYKTYDLNLPVNYPVNKVRPDTALNQITQHASTGASEYKGLYIKFNKQFSHRYMYTASYALSSAKDNNPHASPVDFNNLNNDWGYSAYDQRNAFVFSGSVMLPGKIMVGAIYSYRSRLPFSVTTSTLSPTVFPANPNPNGTAQYVPGTKRNQVNRDFNYAALNAYRTDLDQHVAPYSTACNSGVAPGTGNCLSTNVGPGSVTSTRYSDFDIRISKYFFQHDTRRLEIIGQAFNLFGTENFTTITSTPLTNTFGAPTAAGTVQIGELAAKFTF
jgi:Carboxypeptidase regulatory-like domain